MSAFEHLLAESTWRPFLTPMPVWDFWYVLILPLCVAVSVVYKAIKCESMRQVPWQAARITAYIIAAMAVAAVVLTVIVKVM